MVCDQPLEDVDGPVIRALGEPDREDVLALTTLVYPHYFRPHTMSMGRYFGIHVDGRLAAMIGERMYRMQRPKPCRSYIAFARVFSCETCRNGCTPFASRSFVRNAIKRRA